MQKLENGNHSNKKRQNCLKNQPSSTPYTKCHYPNSKGAPDILLILFNVSQKRGIIQSNIH